MLPAARAPAKGNPTAATRRFTRKGTRTRTPLARAPGDDAARPMVAPVAGSTTVARAARVIGEATRTTMAVAPPFCWKP